MAVWLLTQGSICALALAIEAWLGYPDALFVRIGHPVTWMGAAITRFDADLNRATASPRARRLMGFVAMALLMLATVGIAGSVQVIVSRVMPMAAALLVLGLLASSALAQRSLFTHVRNVGDALRTDGPMAGRRAVAMIVGRDTAALDEAGVTRAAIESLAENFADGIVAPTFWLALLGLPGGMLYKAVNTADSMIGHRTPRHLAFGFAAAKLDDLVNWPAARLAGLWIVLAAALTKGTSGPRAWRIMVRDARGHASPNAGWPESAMAGALGITLGGARAYHGETVVDSSMGDGDLPLDAATITRALALYRHACGINIAVVVLFVIALWR